MTLLLLHRVTLLLLHRVTLLLLLHRMTLLLLLHRMTLLHRLDRLLQPRLRLLHASLLAREQRDVQRGDHALARLDGANRRDNRRQCCVEPHLVLNRLAVLHQETQHCQQRHVAQHRRGLLADGAGELCEALHVTRGGRSDLEESSAVELERVEAAREQVLPLAVVVGVEDLEETQQRLGVREGGARGGGLRAQLAHAFRDGRRVLGRQEVEELCVSTARDRKRPDKAPPSAHAARRRSAAGGAAGRRAWRS